LLFLAFRSMLQALKLGSTVIESIELIVFFEFIVFIVSVARFQRRSDGIAFGFISEFMSHAESFPICTAMQWKAFITRKTRYNRLD